MKNETTNQSRRWWFETSRLFWRHCNTLLYALCYISSDNPNVLNTAGFSFFNFRHAKQPYFIFRCLCSMKSCNLESINYMICFLKSFSKLYTQCSFPNQIALCSLHLLARRSMWVEWMHLQLHDLQINITEIGYLCQWTSYQYLYQSKRELFK